MKRIAVCFIALIGSIPALPATQPAVTETRPIAATRNCAYPTKAISSNREGDVMVRYDVDADGGLSHVALVKSSGSSALDRAALDCVSAKWRNVPAMRSGVAIASPNHKALVRFRLSGAQISPYAVSIYLALSAIVVLICVLVWRRNPGSRM